MSQVNGAIAYTINFYVNRATAAQVDTGIARQRIRDRLLGLGAVDIPNGRNPIVEVVDTLTGWRVSVYVTMTLRRDYPISAIDAQVVDGLRRSGWQATSAQRILAALDGNPVSRGTVGVRLLGGFGDVERTIVPAASGAVDAPPSLDGVGSRVVSSSQPERINSTTGVDVSGITNAARGAFQHVTQPSTSTIVALVVAGIAVSAVAVGYTVRSFK